MEEFFGRCWRCGYDLRGCAGRVCPECGREFDPADPKTRHMGVRRIGRLGRWMMEPVGWWAVVMAAVATAVLVGMTGWPTGGGFSLVEWRYYFWPSNVGWKDFGKEVVGERWGTMTGTIYVCSTAVWVCVLIWSVILGICRRFLLVRHRVPREYRATTWRHPTSLAVLLCFAILWQGYGWANRLAGHFTERQLAIKPAAREAVLTGKFPDRVVVIALLPELGVDGLQRVQRFGGSWWWPTRMRIAALGMLVGDEPAYAIDVLRRRVDGETNRQVRFAMLRLMMVAREGIDLERWSALLESTDSEERGLGADGIGYLRGARGVQKSGGEGWGAAQDFLASDPVIDARAITARAPTVSEQSAIMPRDKLWRMAIEGETPREREAARRALVMLPEPGYQLRVAEWGVWLAKGSELGPGKKQLEAIPPFVHRVGNSAASMQERMHLPSEFYSVFKPIVHLTTNRRMCVDVSVGITRGRPWFVYPMPDDFSFVVDYESPGSRSRPRLGKLASLDPPGMKPLHELRSGVPWMFPGRASSSSGKDPEDIESWGVRWESLLVTPSMEQGMKLAAVPSNPAFAWWKGLRDVPCSYVTNRGETERFLYYDGPTLVSPPCTIQLEGRTLKKAPDPRRFEWRGGNGNGAGAYVEVSHGVARAAAIFPLPRPEQVLPPLEDDAPEVLNRMLRAMGLTDAETKGFMNSWRDEFFKTEGKRFLMFLDPEDYDQLCPMEVIPKPTERVRVGIVWTEF